MMPPVLRPRSASAMPTDHRQAVPERAGRGFDARIAVVGMAAEATVRLAVEVEVLAAEHAEFLQDHVLDHAAMALRHEERVGRGAVRIAAHQTVIDTIDDLRARIGRTDVQRADLLGNVEDPPPDNAGSARARLGSKKLRGSISFIVLPRSAMPVRLPLPEYRASSLTTRRGS